MAELLNFRSALATQDVNDLLGAEGEATRLLATQDAGHQLTGGLRTVPFLGRCQAVITISARLAGLTEVIEQLDPATIRGLTSPENGVEFRREDTLVLFRGFRLLDHPTLLYHVSQAVDHPGIGG